MITITNMRIYILRLLSLTILFTGLFAIEAKLKSAKELPVKGVVITRDMTCLALKAGIVKKEGLEKIKKNDQCRSANYLDVDFSSQTLIHYKVGGDCNMRVNVSGISSDEMKKVVTVVIDNIWGGCRAGGRVAGFLIVDKIPEDFKVEIIENKIDDFNDPRYTFSLQKFVTTQIDLKGCIQMIRSHEFVVRSSEEYLGLIRKDAQQISCTELVSYLDFEKYTYVGILVNSGYCRQPVGLKHWGTSDRAANLITINIRYTLPEVACRALSRYELWLQIPKVNEDFGVEFEIQGES